VDVKSVVPNGVDGGVVIISVVTNGVDAVVVVTAVVTIDSDAVVVGVSVVANNVAGELREMVVVVVVVVVNCKFVKLVDNVTSADDVTKKISHG
jgi:hypothetical protein